MSVIESLSYRQLQQALALCPENTVRRNSKTDVLLTELKRIWSESPRTLELIPTPARKTATKFDWLGLATNRKDAIATIKALRGTHKPFDTVKLNAPNTVLLEALRQFANTTPEVNVPAPAPKTMAQSVTPTEHTLTVPVTHYQHDLPKGPTLKQRAAKLLTARERLEVRLSQDVTTALLEDLEDVNRELAELPARAFI